MQMCQFQKLTPEPHVSFHLEEFSLAKAIESSLVVFLRSQGFPCKIKRKGGEGGGGGGNNGDSCCQDNGFVKERKS